MKSEFTYVLENEILSEQIKRLTSGPGGIMEMKQTIADKEKYIGRLEEALFNIIKINEDHELPYPVRSRHSVVVAETVLEPKS